MSGFLSVLINILIMIIILGVLISIHEAGHLAMAKLFHVYCFDYSIGFGPALIHRKRKKGETYFSLRAFPLGGYVSMYGETGEVPESYEQPPEERSLEKIAKWKKSIILVAGVTLNFGLGLILIFLSCSCFPNYYASYGASVSLSSTADPVTTYLVPSSYQEGAPILSYIDTYINEHPSEDLKADEDFVLSLPYIDDYYGFILDDDIHLKREIDGVISDYNPDIRYVATYVPSTLVEDHELGLSIRLYEASTTPVSSDSLLYQLGVHYVPDPKAVENNLYFETKNVESGVFFNLKPRIIVLPEDRQDATESYFDPISVGDGIRVNIESKGYSNTGINLKMIKQWLGWKGSWRAWAKRVPDAMGAIVKGFGSLFTSKGFLQVSGIVGMTAALSSVQAMGGVANLFYFAGLISINLAFFNLLPIPGLDGWQLLVTAFEAIFKRKMPRKVQGIVSYIGIGLLLLFALAIMIKDVVMLFI